MLNGAAITEPGPHGERIVDDSLFVAINGGADPVEFVAPDDHWSPCWVRTIDTATGRVAAGETVGAGERFEAAGRSIVVFVAG